jgi:hypothetical protein
MSVTIPGLPRVPMNARVNGGPSAVEFFDFFFADNLGLAQNNFSTFLQWTVTEGSVDLAGGDGLGVFGAPPDDQAGRFVDLGGSTGDPGKFETTLAYPIVAGQRFNLTFDYRSTEGDFNSATVTIGDRSWSVSTDDTSFHRFSRDFIADETGVVKIVFQGDERDTDNSGIGIDGVLFGAVLSNSPDEVLVASPNPNHLEGRGGDDTLIGNIYDDVLRGGEGDDIILGALGDDRLNGGAGTDRLTGGLGADLFVFTDVSDSQTGSRDRILDFSNLDGDRIDLRAIDARSGEGNQAFDFVGADRFSGAAGELSVSYQDGFAVVRGDIDGDAKADFSIRLVGVTEATPLVAADFIL